MRINFTKMHGCGNDYIYMSGENITNPHELAVKLSDRNKSIGGDGIVLILTPTIQGADARMRMFNADGSEGLMCGSSIRNVGKYLHDHAAVRKKQMKIETASGVKNIELIEGATGIENVKVDMGKAELTPGKIPVTLTGDMVVARRVSISGNVYEITCLSMGNPHAIIFHDDIDHFDLQAAGIIFEQSRDLFPAGINLGVAQMLSRTNMKMRVWERGTGETKASGTGACAAAVAAVMLGYADSNVSMSVELAGGTLTIDYTNDTVYLTGDTATSFEGVVTI